MMNAGMPIPVTSASMPMPSYGKDMVCNKEDALLRDTHAASPHRTFTILTSPFPMHALEAKHMVTNFLYL
jgi:hypothetical protein